MQCFQLTTPIIRTFGILFVMAIFVGSYACGPTIKPTTGFCISDDDCFGQGDCLQNVCVIKSLSDGGVVPWNEVGLPDAAPDATPETKPESKPEDKPDAVCREGATKPCQTGKYAPCDVGSQLCQNGQWTPCVQTKMPQPEICDGKDNDCDGSVDEGNPGGGKACTDTSKKGECQKGTQQCQRGTLTCVSNTRATAEVCDGKDNNCDGSVDESVCECKPGVRQPCGSFTKGICKKGNQTCQANGKWGPCVGGVEPKKEACNGLDDDCDGQTDELLTRECRTDCGRGTETCDAGKWVKCSARKPEPIERCNGIDDDCDGYVDNPKRGTTGILSEACYGGPAGTQGVGICKAGKRECRGAQWGSCLGEMKPNPKGEQCNNVTTTGKPQDENCNGVTDEHCPCKAPVTTPSQGVCQNFQNNAKGACSPPPEYQKAEDKCDKLDNDCDGAVDEGCGVLHDFAIMNPGTPTSVLNRGFTKLSKFQDGKYALEVSTKLDCLRDVLIATPHSNSITSISYSCYSGTNSGTYYTYAHENLHRTKDLTVHVVRPKSGVWGSCQYHMINGYTCYATDGQSSRTITSVSISRTGRVISFPHKECNSTTRPVFATTIGSNGGFVHAGSTGTGTCQFQTFTNRGVKTTSNFSFWLPSTKQEVWGNISLKPNASNSLVHNETPKLDDKWTLTGPRNKAYSVSHPWFRKDRSLTLLTYQIQSPNENCRGVSLLPNGNQAHTIYSYILPPIVNVLPNILGVKSSLTTKHDDVTFFVLYGRVK